MRDRPYCAKLYLTLRICKVPLIGARGRIVPCAQLQIGKACRKILQVVIKINRAAFKRNATNAETKQIDIELPEPLGKTGRFESPSLPLVIHTTGLSTSTKLRYHSRLIIDTILTPATMWLTCSNGGARCGAAPSIVRPYRSTRSAGTSTEKLARRTGTPSIEVAFVCARFNRYR